MSNYKATREDHQSMDNVLNYTSIELSHLSNHKTQISSDFVPSYLEMPNLYQIIRDKCDIFVASFHKCLYKTSSEIMMKLGCFFRNARIELNQSNVNVLRFIKIFEDTQIFQIITYIIKNLDNFREINNIIFFVSNLSLSNTMFCSYLADIFLFDFITSLDAVLNLNLIEQNNKDVFNILINVFPRINLKVFDVHAVIPIMLSYTEFLYQCKLILPNDIIKLMSKIIYKVDMDIRLYQAFIQFLLKEGCLNSDSFPISISTLYIIIKISWDRNLIFSILRCEILDLFSDIYAENEHLSTIFPIYLKTLTKILKIFSVINESEIHPEIWKELLVKKQKILSQFSHEHLLLKLEGFNNNGIESARSIIEFIHVLLQQNCLIQVFKSSRKLFNSILLIYKTGDFKSKEKILKCFLDMMHYHVFFRKEVLSQNFVQSFIDFIEYQYEKPIFLIMEIINFSIDYCNKKKKHVELLINLYSSEDFMAVLYQASQETQNEDLRSCMYNIWLKLYDFTK